MNSQRGFTLIEVVAAFVLLTVILVMAFEVFSAGLARAGELEDRSRALVVAQSQLAAAGVEQALHEGQTSGDSEDRRFHWDLSIAKTNEGIQPGQPAPSTYFLYRIDVLVTWLDAQGRTKSLPLSTMGIWTDK